MAKKLQELLTEIATKSQAVTGIFDAADKRDGVNTKDEIEQIKKLNKELEGMETEAAELKSLQDIRNGNDGRLADLAKTSNQIPFAAPQHRGEEASVKTLKTLGDMVFDDPQFKAWWDKTAGTGHISERSTVQSPPVQIKTLITGASATQGGPFVFPDFKPTVDISYQRPLTVRDIITVGETGSDTVEYVRVTGVTNAAAPTAEATSVSDGAKPESAIATVRVTEAVKTIAHWIPATSRALADAGQLRTLIDNFLRYGLNEELEDQILTGAGTGENFTGVLVVSGTTAQAYDTSILTTTRKGRTKVRTTGRATPNAWVMHPNDWQAIDLLQDNEARYYYGGPMNPGQPRLWGLPVVESEGMTEGTAVVADWKLAVLWDRMQTQLTMTNSHSDFFVRNLIAILAELRAAFGIIRPKAFVLCDLTP